MHTPYLRPNSFLKLKKGSLKPWFQHQDTPLGNPRAAPPRPSKAYGFFFEKSDDGADPPPGRPELHAFVQRTNGRAHMVPVIIDPMMTPHLPLARSLGTKYGLPFGLASE